MKLLWTKIPLLGVVGALTACGDVVDVDTGGNTAQQALATTILLSSSAVTIDEGSSASVDVTRICVDIANQPVTIVADFDDVNDLANVTRTIAPPVGGFPTTLNCGAGFAVCDPAGLGAANPTDCNGFTHRYDDNLTAVAQIGTFQAPATAPQQTQNFTVTVNNVAPTANLSRNPAADAEGADQTLTGTVADPGRLSTEIARVKWEFTNADNVEDSTTVDCTCAAAVSCIDEDGDTISAPEGTDALCDQTAARVSRSASRSRTRTFLEGPATIVTTLTITDKDGGAATATDSLATTNQPPQINALTVALVPGGATGFAPIDPSNAAVSAISATPTLVSEGFSYGFNGTISEAGIDVLDIDWDLLVGVAGGDFSATAAVTKASYPNLTNLNPATGLAPRIIYDDDGGTNPNDVDRTVRLTVADDDGGSANADRFVRVVDVDPIITSFTSTNASINEGGTVTFTVAAVSGARDNTALDPINTSGFVWTIDGRNISSLSSLTNAYTVVSGCTSASTTCEVRFLDDDAPAGEPTWDVRVTVADEDSTTNSSTITVNVANVLPVLTAFALTDDDINEGETASVSFTFTDPAGSLDGPYANSINFPGVGASTGTNTAPGTTTGVTSGVYGDNDTCQSGSSTSGSCTITADLCEDGGARCALQVTDALTVNNVAPTVTATAVTPTDLVEGVDFDLDGSFNDVAGSLDNNYAFTWSFTDGTTPRTSPGTSSFANRLTAVDVSGISGFTNVPAAGLSDVAFTLNVVDEDTGSTTSTAITADVRDNAPQISVQPTVALGNGSLEPTGTASVSLTVAAETAADLLTNVTVDWGDGTTERYTTGVNGTSTTPAALTLTKGAGDTCVTGTCVAGYADGRRSAVDGAAFPYVVAVTVNDEDSSTAAALRNANVVDVDPVLTAANIVPDVATPIVIAEGTAAAFVVRTTDVSSSDRAGSRLTTNVNAPARPLLAQIDFGDGTPVEVIEGTIQGDDTIIRTAHVYTQIGQFPVRIRTFDQDALITGGVLQPALPANRATQVNTINDGVSPIVFATVEVVNLAPVLTDVFTSQPVSEGVDMNAVALVNNRGLDPIAHSFIFDCGVPATANDAAIEAAFDAARAGAGADIEAATSAVGHHTYANDSLDAFTVCVEVCDDDNADNSCDYGAVAVEVFNQPATLSLSAADATINEGGSTLLTAVASEPSDDLFVYAFDCQDDGVIDSLVEEDDDIAIGASADFNCVYPDNGTFTARVTADDGLVQTERTVTITVANVAPVVTAAVASAAAVTEGATSSLTFTGATDVAADPIRVEYDIDGDNAPDLVSTAANGAASFRFANASGASTSNAFRARACDDENACSAFVSGTAVVNNAAPSVVVVNVPGQVAIASPLAVSVVATDVGNDALTYAFAFTGPQSLNIAAQASSVASASFTTTGSYTVTVTVSDGAATSTSTANFTVVEGANEAPRITSLTTSNATPNEGGTVTLTAAAVDNGSDPLTFAFDCGNGTTGVAATATTATCTYAQSGNFVASVVVSDNAVPAQTATQSLAIRVVNVAPAIVAASSASVAEGVASIFTVTGLNDVAGDVIRVEYDVDGDGAFDVFSNAENGAASFRFSNPSGASTSNAFTARACDNEGACSATVNGTAVVTNVAPTISVVNVPAQVGIAAPIAVSAVAVDAGNDTNLVYTFAFTGPQSITVGPQASSVASTSFTTTGSYTVAVTVSDGVASSAASQATFTVVEGPNEAPRITSFGTSTATPNEGSSVTLTANAVDNGNDPLTFAFDCGNGTTVAASAANTTSCTYAQSGNFIASVVVADDAGSSVTQSLAIRAVNVAPVLGTVAATTVNEGAASTLTVTGSTDVAGDSVRIEYDTNGDGAFDLVSNAANGSATVRFADGSNAISARACDNEGACSAATTAAAIVNNVAPVISSVNVPATALAGSPVTVAVAATDAGNDALSYAFTFRRGGDVVTTVGPQAASTVSFTFGDSGTYDVEVAVTDAANAPATVATTTATATFLVNDLNVNLVATALPTSIDEGGSTAITVTSTNGVGPFVVDYDVNADGDFVDAVDVRDQACEGDADAPCRITASFPQNRAGNIAFRVIVSVTDTGNNDALETAIVAVEVKNVAPTLAAVADASVEERATFSTTLTATDPGVTAANADFPAPDALRFSLVSGPAGLTVSTAGVVSWTPTFSDEGSHTVTVRATDSDGESDETSFNVAVTIIDANDNGVSDTQEFALNGGVLLDPDAGETDSDNDGVSDLDEVLAGTLPNESDAPRAPVVISPNNVIVDTTTPTLTVANAVSPRGLELTYAFVVLDSAGLVAASGEVAEGASTTSFTLAAEDALDEQATYTWFAFAKDGLTTLDGTDDIEGEVSDTGTFTVDAENAGPSSPDALTPANDAEFLEGTFVTLEARAVVDADGDAVRYVFQVATDAAFTTIVKTSPARDVPVFSVPEALAVGSYFWRATASDGTATSAPGTVGTFDIVAIEINEAPTAPTITSPNNVTIAATSATLTIGAGADADNDELEYEFEIADNAAFANADVSGAQVGLTFAVSGLDEDKTLFWRARAFDGQLYSDWVSATFVVDADNGVPTGLALLSPTDGALLTSAPVAFTATEAVDPEGDALTYQVVVSKSADFSAPIVDAAAVVEGGVVRLAAPETLATALALGVPYFWRVTASDGTNSIEASASFSLFKPQEIPDNVSVDGGGCNASGNDSNGTAVALALLGLVVLRRRRR